jgi:hypothetical protein
MVPLMRPASRISGQTISQRSVVPRAPTRVLLVREADRLALHAKLAFKQADPEFRCNIPGSETRCGLSQ